MQKYTRRKRRSKKPFRDKKKGHLGRNILIIFLLCILAAIGSGVGYTAWVIHENAEYIYPSEIYSLVNQRSTLYDGEGKKIENLSFSGGNRDIVSYEDMPQTLINAIVSIEDKTFWKHHGFNIIRMIGAVKERLTGGGQIRGTSTLTQQLARNVYLADTKSERTMERKIVEGWYAWQIEKTLTKEQILEAYLNTVYFGFDSYGVEAAADNYFSKHTKDLSEEECVALAAIPQSPDTYALVRYTQSGDTEYNGDATEDRRKLVLSLMQEEGYITAEQRAAIEADDLKGHIKVREKKLDSGEAYYIDYAIQQITEDLAQELGTSNQKARQLIYTKGYSIYTCLDPSVQKILDEEINDGSNYTGISYYRTDGDGNILSNQGNIIARPISSYFNDKGTFKLKKKEFRANQDGSLTILKNKRLALYETENGCTVAFRTLYRVKDGTLRLVDGGTLSIPEEYTSLDEEGNCVVAAQFLTENPDFFVYDDEKIKISKEHYTLSPERKQPQAAAVIMDNKTGHVIAMNGGRGDGGRQLYNRAINPRQPGSSIKPIAVYGPALQLSAEAAKDGRAMQLDNSGGNNFGSYISAGSVINDSKVTVNGRVWPRNSYGGYRGKMTLRTAIQDSVNVAAYKVFKQIGEEESVNMLKKAGVTTVDEEGDTSDLNPAALALGGMTRGISPLEMCAAYAVFPNGGIYKRPLMYSKVVDADGQEILTGDTEEKRIYDEGVAFIMTDLLQGVVRRGTGRNAAIGTQPVGGKTGTTSDQFDVWFCGFTPDTTAALWSGCDANLALTSSSSAAASFWSSIMRRVCTDSASFDPMPDNVQKIRGEYYVNGTYSGVTLPKPTKEKKKEKSKKEKNNSNSYQDENGIEYTKPAKKKEKHEEPATDSNWEDEFDWN